MTEVLIPRPHEMFFFSYYHAIWQFYNFTVFWLVIVSCPRNNPLWVFISVSLLLLFICLFVWGNQISLYRTLRELTIQTRLASNPERYLQSAGDFKDVCHHAQLSTLLFETGLAPNVLGMPVSAQLSGQ